MPIVIPTANQYRLAAFAEVSETDAYGAAQALHEIHGKGWVAAFNDAMNKRLDSLYAARLVNYPYGRPQP